MALLLAVQSATAIITVQIGGATRLNSLSRQRERYSCYWDCGLVSCKFLDDDDDTCAYDCEKICRVRYDYAGRSGSNSNAPAQASGASAAGIQVASGASASTELRPKSGASSPVAGGAAAIDPSELVGGKLTTCRYLGYLKNSFLNNLTNSVSLYTVGSSVRLHLPRNATARSFAIWERCDADSATSGKLVEKPFNL